MSGSEIHNGGEVLVHRAVGTGIHTTFVLGLGAHTSYHQPDQDSSQAQLPSLFFFSHSYQDLSFLRHFLILRLFRFLFPICYSWGFLPRTPNTTRYARPSTAHQPSLFTMKFLCLPGAYGSAKVCILPLPLAGTLVVKVDTDRSGGNRILPFSSDPSPRR